MLLDSAMQSGWPGGYRIDAIMADSAHSTLAGAGIAVCDFCKAYGSSVAVDSVSLNILPGEFFALLGPSGSGKSTLLMGMAGFDTPSSGQVLIDGADCTRVPPNRRNIGMVFQNYTLFPHLSVLENVAFPLKMRGIGRARRNTDAERALESVRLGGFGKRMPSQLSGGQQQRVALARAIIYRPPLLLMDEPFSALDKKLREEMRQETKRLHAELGMTIVFVTHDQEEALTMADRVAVLKDGRVQQVAAARELYERPANLFSAGFIGNMNFIPVTLDRQRARLPGGEEWPLSGAALMGPATAGPATLAIRPERLSLTGGPGDLRLCGKIRDVVYSGADTVVVVGLPDGSQLRARVNSVDALPGEGQDVSLYCGPAVPLIYGAAAA